MISTSSICKKLLSFPLALLLGRQFKLVLTIETRNKPGFLLTGDLATMRITWCLSGDNDQTEVCVLKFLKTDINSVYSLHETWGRGFRQLSNKKKMGKILMANQSESMAKIENLNIFEKEWSFISFNS